MKIIAYKQQAQLMKEKALSTGNWQKIARERGKAQDVDMSAQAHEVGTKRVGNMEALLEAEGIVKKRLCEIKDYEGNHGDYGAAVSALQHRREQ